MLVAALRLTAACYCSIAMNQKLRNGLVKASTTACVLLKVVEVAEDLNQDAITP